MPTMRCLQNIIAVSFDLCFLCFGVCQTKVYCKCFHLEEVSAQGCEDDEKSSTHLFMALLFFHCRLLRDVSSVPDLYKSECQGLVYRNDDNPSSAYKQVFFSFVFLCCLCTDMTHLLI